MKPHHASHDQYKVLCIGSLTEFGERYSYYVIQALLIFFLIERFNIAQSQSATLVGTVLSMVYISALIGGYVADKLINYYRAAFLGSLFMIAGSGILALSSSKNELYLGLALISVSTGLIKSNISSFIGRFYDKSALSDGNRDFGFNVFYVGINLGSFFALFMASSLKESYGFSAPFYSSLIVACLISLNLIIGFFVVRRYIADVTIDLMKTVKAMLVLGGYIICVFVVLKNPILADFSILIAAFVCIGILLLSARKKYWRNVIKALVFFLLSVLYWALYFQLFISLLLFISLAVDHKVLFFRLSSSQFLGVESLGVLIFGFFMGRLWMRLESKGKAVADIDKFRLAFVLIAVMFLLYWAGSYFSAGEAKVSAWVIISGLIVLSISELSLSAIGLSLVTKIAPPNFVSLYMGIWLVTLGIGGKLAGFMSSFIALPNDIAVAKQNMAVGLLSFMFIAIGGIVICVLVRRLMQADKSGD